MNWAGLDWSQIGLLIGLKLAIRFPGAGWSWLGWLLTCLRHPSSRLSLSCSHSTDRVPRKGKETCKYFIQVSIWVKFVLPIGQNVYHSQAQCHCQRTLSKACVQKGGIMQMSSCHLGSWPFTVYTKRTSYHLHSGPTPSVPTEHKIEIVRSSACLTPMSVWLLPSAHVQVLVKVFWLKEFSKKLTIWIIKS